MADFCKDCSIAMFGEDFGDLAGLLSEQQVAKGMLAQVLCEDCGVILVDNDGKKQRVA